MLVPASSISLTKNLDVDWVFSGAFRPDTFYGRNIGLLNNNNENDQIWYARHVLDLKFDLTCGQKTYACDVANFRIVARNKGVWGNPGSIASTLDVETKTLNAVGGSHKHGIPRHFFWIRECWLSFDLVRAAGLDFTNKHTMIIGAFPFQLGRGIALGDAYAVGHGILGFYTDIVVDQFAFGVKISGDIVPKVLTYDIYSAILQNKSSNLSEVAERVLGQQYGRIDTPSRGFGVINFLIATRLNWTVFDSSCYGKLTLEPYAFYNNDPEQMIEFLGDASSKLGTVGLASEYEGSRFAVGFDFAQNFGRQAVKAWDRNQVVVENRDGYVVEVNNQVHLGSATGATALFIPKSSSQKLIESTRRDNEAIGVEEVQFNGKSIGTSSNQGELFNDKLRFRNSYNNIYKGWMFVLDGSVYALDKDLQFSVAAGVASGDNNPNFDVVDGDFTGFIGLQELYWGKRVKSAYVLGGAGKLKRPLSAPEDGQVPSKFSVSVSGFTNLVFCGTGMTWKPVSATKKFSINPNMLAFWQQFPSKKFDLITKKDSKDDARTFLGVETNVYFDYNLFKDLRLFLVTSIFFPGTHYEDIRGKPLDRAQLAAISDLDVTGSSSAFVPNIGKDVSYTFNIGLEYKF